MIFTQDWFTPTIARLEPVVPAFAQRVLEIGCFEGRSTIWFLDRWPDAQVTTIDSFHGGGDIGLEVMLGVRERFLSNTVKYGKRLTLLEGRSHTMLAKLQHDYFDFIYVDGSHTADGVYIDGMLAFPLLTDDGVMVFDDYGWGNEQKTVAAGVCKFRDAWRHQVVWLPSDSYIAVFRRRRLA